MSVFAVIAQPGKTPGLLPGAIAEHFPTANYALGNEVWLVAGVGTAKEISDKLGISDGANGTGVVLQVDSYFGRANPNIWSWIKENWESS